jgi:hypothetical protein
MGGWEGWDGIGGEVSKVRVMLMIGELLKLTP